MVIAPAVLSCSVLAVAVLVAGPVAPARLAGLHGRPVARRGPALPAATATAAGAVVGLLALGPVGGVAGAAGAGLWRRRRVRRAAARGVADASAQLADALDRIVEEVRAGAHPAAALAGVRADGPRARAALGPAAAAAALGDGIPAALLAAGDRHPDLGPHLRRVGRAWVLAERHGVPLADLLAGVHADLRWRAAHAGRVQAQLAGPRATAAVLTALPLLGLALGELVGAAPLQVLRGGVLGQVLVAAGLGLTAGGALWSGHILRAAVPR